MSQLTKNKLQNLTKVWRKRHHLSYSDFFYTNEMNKHLVDQSLEYARQQNKHAFDVNEEEMARFTSIHLLSGYHTLP